MPHFKTLATILIYSIFVVPLAAQSLVIKPYYGYLLPRMSEVNDQIDRQIGVWRELLGEPIASPGNIDGHSVFGAQVRYHFTDDYAVTLEVSQYQEKIASDYFRPATSPAERFFYEREVKTFDIALNLNYYFDYDETSLLNKYISFGAGLLFAEANSITLSSFLTDSQNFSLLPVDTRGEFSGNSLSANFAGGLELRVAGPLSLWGEAGYSYAKLGEMDGKVRTINEQQASAFTTNSAFDFSGFYFHAGLGLGLPF